MQKHFDELSKALAGGVPKRTALRRFLAGATGAVLGLAGAGLLTQPESVDAQGCPTGTPAFNASRGRCFRV
jgi:hypothetical protein